MLTLGDLRRELAKLSSLPDDTPIASDVLEGPDDGSADVVGFTGGIPDHWKGVGNADELPETLWIHLRLVDMEQDDDDEEKEDED